MVERLDDFDYKTRSFTKILNLYGYSDLVSSQLLPKLSKLKAKSVISAHSSPYFLRRNAAEIDTIWPESDVKHERILLSNPSSCLEQGEERKKASFDDDLLSHFEPNSFDLVISNLGLHWINDLERLFTQINTILKPDGCFLATMFGGDTLLELRSSFIIAEQERDGGISPHISPSVSFQDAARLLTSSKFALTSVDGDTIKIQYPDAFALMHDLRCMGESNANISVRFPIPAATMMSMAAIYQQFYGVSNNSNSESSSNNNIEGIPATFQIIHMIGWKPDKTKQQQPTQRGSGKVSMIDALEDVDPPFQVHTISLDDENDKYKKN